MVASVKTMSAIARHMKEEGHSDDLIASYLKIGTSELQKILMTQRTAPLPTSVLGRRPAKDQPAMRIDMSAPEWKVAQVEKSRNGRSMAANKMDSDMTRKRAKPAKGTKKCPTEGCDRMIPKDHLSCDICWSIELTGRPPLHHSLQYVGGATRLP